MPIKRDSPPSKGLLSKFLTSTPGRFSIEVPLPLSPPPPPPKKKRDPAMIQNIPQVYPVIK